MPPVPGPSRAGFSLVEALVATAIVVTVVASLAQLVAGAAASARASRRALTATLAASAKVEQLRGLAWGYDADGTPVSDVTSDTTVTPPRSSGGRGLSPSPPGVLGRPVDGWTDYLDARGEALGGGGAPPDGAVFARRWAVTPLDLADALLIAVCVLPSRAGPAGGEPAPDVCMTTVRVRQP